MAGGESLDVPALKIPREEGTSVDSNFINLCLGFMLPN